MFKFNLNLRRGLTFVVLIAAVLSVNTAFATSSIMRNVANACAAAGNAIPGDKQAEAGDCDTCHGSSRAYSASRGNTATIVAYFCPDVVVTPPSPTCTDNDGDGYDREGNCGLADCDDRDPAINPGAQEDCGDNVDNNCNGMVDTADPGAINCPIACTDNDGDTYNTEGGACGAVDCDDNNAAIHPGAEESCTDGSDNNCNGMIDDADAACASPGDPMQALRDQIMELQRQLAECQAGTPPTTPPTTPPADESDDSSDDESDDESDDSSDEVVPDRRSSRRSSRRDRD
jgi:hypothetical protein